ncbi:malate synthase G [Arthrobacter sp. NPDC058130]|uniref:malate synthase G n=1 Tax=Arthrobacter sp. NPDC058130 TaxID=3346353 RepID=UPI0036E16022
MNQRITIEGLSIASTLVEFAEKEALPGTGIETEQFWKGTASIVRDLRARNRELLDERQRLQTRIDEYHAKSPGEVNPRAYEEFLRQIGYLVQDDPADVTVSTDGVDAEISRQAGPQLVVPLLNRRFAVNAANARWGSLYDALYGTDAIDQTGSLRAGDSYNPVRGSAVVAAARRFLDTAIPLAEGSHEEAVSYVIDDGRLTVLTAPGTRHELADAGQLVGYRGVPSSPEAIIFVNNGLHFEILFDGADPVGAADIAKIKDIILESAVTTIMDLEDSVAAVDADDKVIGYRNWLELMRGTLSETVTKNGSTFERVLEVDRDYLTPEGESRRLPGRSLLFIRQVGHLMTSDAIIDESGDEVPEGVLDAIFTALGSLHDIRGLGALKNSRTGSMYVVKPKMHGPDEVAFTVELFERVERLLDMPAGTIKLGIMDEERRTSVNLRACIGAARERIAFINTGFLDRTGDEMHTSMHAGPFVRKAEMRTQRWIQAYEDSNVRIGLGAGLSGRAQIGKGMWAMPDRMSAMLAEKIAHPQAGATTAWVPSPTAATLHALHYHEVDVFSAQREIMARASSLPLGELLVIPLAKTAYSTAEKQEELDNNLQSILGYVVRWVDAGVGCSKVPDIHDIALMEDRATCRISSQHVANWLLHGLVSPEQVRDSLRRMAVIVDGQNASDPGYRSMSPGYDGDAFLAASELVFEGTSQPSGYTEPILHRHRQLVKLRALAEVIA